MTINQPRWTVAVSVLAALLGLLVTPGDGRAMANRRAASSGLPPRTLWAWERREDLRFVPRGTGVAYLAKTITIGYSGAEERPRMQPLRISDGTPLLAVVRIEHGGGPASETVRRAVADAVVEAGSRADVIGVQVDFDARVSDRKFYGQLLKDVREGLPRGKVLSMTALVSWCTNDDWIEGLPVDEAVPMYFRMGRDERTAQAWSGRTLTEPLCRGAVGRATDEARTVPKAAREYWFSTVAWTQEEFEKTETGR